MRITIIIMATGITENKKPKAQAEAYESKSFVKKKFIVR